VPGKNLQSEIAKVAYEIFKKNRYSHGHDLDQWLEAERIVLSNQSAKTIKRDKIPKTAKTDPAENVIGTTVNKTNQKNKPVKEKKVVKKAKNASPKKEEAPEVPAKKK
jgi:hypothetical protein